MFSPGRQHTNSGCIDPRLLFASGGTDEYPYNVGATEGVHPPMDFQEPAAIRQLRKELEMEEDLEKILSSESGRGPAPSLIPHPARSMLNARAEVFVPGDVRPMLAMATTPRSRRMSRAPSTTSRTSKSIVSPIQDRHTDGRVVKRGRRPTIRLKVASSLALWPDYDANFPRLRGPREVQPLAGHGSNSDPPSMIVPQQWVMDAGYHFGDRNQCSYFPHDPGAGFETPTGFSIASINPGFTHSAPTASSGPTLSTGELRCNAAGCEKVFRLQSELTKHQRSHLPKWQRRFGCDLCPERANDRKDIRRHKLRVHDGQFEICPECGTRIGRDDNLRRHLRDVHGQPPTSSESSALSPSAGIAPHVQILALGTRPPSPATDFEIVKSRTGAGPRPLWTTVLMRGLS